MNASPLAYFAPEDPSDPLVEEMTCSVCMELLNNPSEIQPCTHMYCEACQRSLTKCPECRGPIQGHRAVNRKLLNLLDSIKGKCTVCDWTGTFGIFRETHRPNVHNQPASPRREEPSPQPQAASSAAGGSTDYHTHRDDRRRDHRMRVQALLANLQNVRGGVGLSTSHSTNINILTSNIMTDGVNVNVDQNVRPGGGFSFTSAQSATSPIPTTSTPANDNVFNNIPDVLIRRIRTVFHELAEDVPIASLPLVQSSDRLFASDGITPRTVSVLRPCVAYQACHQLGWIGTTAFDILEMFRISEVSLEDLPVASAMTTVGALLPRPTSGRLSGMLNGINGALFASMAPVVTLFQFTQWASLRSDAWDRAAMARHYSISQSLLDEALAFFPTVATQALLSEEHATEIARRFFVSRNRNRMNAVEMAMMAMQKVRDLKESAVRAAASCTVPIQQILMRSREARVAAHPNSSYITLDHILLACGSCGDGTGEPTPSAFSILNNILADRRNMMDTAFGVHNSSGSGSVPVGSHDQRDASRVVEEIVDPSSPPPAQQQQRSAPPSQGLFARRRQEQERRRNAAEAAASAASAASSSAAVAPSSLSVTIPENMDPFLARRAKSVFHALAEDVPMAALPLVKPSDRLFTNDRAAARTVSVLRPCVAYQACHQLGWVGTTSTDILEMYRLSGVPLETLPVGSAMATVGALLPRPTSGPLSEVRSAENGAVLFANMAPVVTLPQFMHWASLREGLSDRSALAASYSLPQNVVEMAIRHSLEVSTKALLNETHATEMAKKIITALSTNGPVDERVMMAMRTVHDLKESAVRAAASCTVPIQQILMRSREARVAAHPNSSYITLDHILRACACLRVQPGAAQSPSFDWGQHVDVAFQYMTTSTSSTRGNYHPPSRVEEIVDPEPTVRPMGFFERRRVLARERQERERRAAEEVARNLTLDTDVERERQSQEDAEYDQVPDLDTLLHPQGSGASSSSSAPPPADAFPGQRLTFFRRVQKSFVRQKGDKKRN